MLEGVSPPQLIAIGSALATVLGTLVITLITLIWQTHAKRNDEKLTAQLTRLNRQLSELYGPLYALYEAGERNFLRFLWTYAPETTPVHKRTFLPGDKQALPAPSPAALAEYRRRMEHLFMPTNTEMEAAIIRHADLIIGVRMPDDFSSFLAHVAAAKLMVQRWQSDEDRSVGDWKRHQVEYDYPRAISHRVRASFEVLKKAQRKVLTGKLRSVDEKDLEDQIESRIEELSRDWELSGPGYANQFPKT